MGHIGLLLLALALLVVAPGALSQSSPYDYVSSRTDMTFMKKCIDNLLPKNKQPWTATQNKALTMFLVTDEGFRTTFSGLNIRTTLGTDPERFCTVVTKKMNNTRNAIFKYHVLAANLGARTRAQLPGNCPVGPDGLPGCPYNTQAGGKNLLDVITVAEADDVVGTDKTYLIGGVDANYADYVKFPNGTNDYDRAVKGRILHTINALLVPTRYVPIPKSPSPSPAPKPAPKPAPTPSPASSPGPSIYDFLSQRVADLSRVKASVDAADLFLQLSDPSLAWTCFFPDDDSADWNQLWAGVYGEGRNILQQTQYVNQCWDSVRAGALTNPKCPNATREYVGVMQNVYLQSCSPSAPLVSTDVWANRANLSTVAPYSGLTTWRMGPNPANASTTLWVTTVFDPFPMPNSGLLLPNVLNAQGVVAIRKRDNLVANSMNALSVTRQVITLYNLTQRVNALADTTCYFPSNQAWALRFADTLTWNVTLEPADSYNRAIMRNVILQSCYNPPSAAGSQNAGANAVRRLVDTDEFAWETALGWGSSTGIVVQKTPYTGPCGNNVTVSGVATSGALTNLPNVDLEALGYCTQCAQSDPATGLYAGCAFTVYSIATGGASGFDPNPTNTSASVITGLGYSRARSPVAYWVPHDIVGNSNFNDCAAKLFAATNYYPYVEQFDTSGWTLFIPTDDGCQLGLQTYDSTTYSGTLAQNIATAIANGYARSLVKNMFVVNAYLSSGAINNFTSAVTDQGLFGNSAIGTNTLIFRKTGAISLFQRYPGSSGAFPGGFPQMTADVLIADIPVQRNPNALGGVGLAGYVHMTSMLLTPYLVAHTTTIQNLLNQGAQYTLLAPTDTAFSNYLNSAGIGGNWRDVLCNTTNGRAAQTADLLNAHFIAGVYFGVNITANNNTAANLYTYAFNASYKIQILNLNGLYTVRQQMPITSQTFVSGKYDNAINGTAAVAHMITAVLALPPEAALFVNLVDKFNLTLPSGVSTPATAYLNTPDTVATVLVPSVNAVNAFLGRVSFAGTPMSYADCIAPSGTPQQVAAKLAVCGGIVQFAVLPGTQFLPSFTAADYTLNPPIVADGTFKYILIGNNTGAGSSATKIAYRLDTSTNPIVTTSLAFQTTTSPPCSGLAVTSKGPIPAGVPNFLTKQQGMIYVISQVLFPQEIYNSAIAGSGATYAGCPP
eukprot:XP_001694471.1 flagellar associated protein [Chlamydomonas reinhardtii]